MSAPRVEDLVTGGIDLARRIARAHPLPPGADRPNVEGAALLGLTKAALSFDSARGIPFGAYASQRIRGEIIDALREEDHLTRTARRRLGDGTSKLTLDARRPSSLNRAVGNLAAKGAGDGDSVADERIDFIPDDKAEEAFRFVEMRLTLLECLGKLTERQLAIIALRYFGGFTEVEIAHIFALSESRISQINVLAQQRMGADLPAPRKLERPKVTAAHGLTDREAQIVGLVSEGMSSPQIAGELSITVETVKSHMKHAAAKWGTHGRAHIVGEAYRRGILRTAA